MRKISVRKAVAASAVAGLLALGGIPTAALADESEAQARAEMTIDNLLAAHQECLLNLETILEGAGLSDEQVELALAGYETTLSQLVDPKLDAISTALEALQDSPDGSSVALDAALDAALAAGNALLTADQQTLTACPSPALTTETNEGLASPPASPADYETQSGEGERN